MAFAYNFTEDVRRALVTAREEAQRLRHGYVGTEHLALGVLRTARGRAAIVLATVDAAAITAEIEQLAGPGQSAPVQGVDLPYTSRGKRVLELAMREALEMGDAEVDVEHLLLGLLREEKGIGVQVLHAAGLELEAARAVVLREAGGGSDRQFPSRPNRLLLRILEWAGLAPRR
jgi:ATP-dependent Clp protease ATP-binding subunit ClpC